MPYKQLSFEDDSINRIKSHLKTLSGYRETSVALRGYQTESTYQLASALAQQVAGIVEANPDSGEVARWGAKFTEYVKQYHLDEPRVGD